MTNNRYIIIPARLESKRLPGKLLLEKDGSTVIDNSICAALNCLPPDNIVVATDSIEIAKIADAWKIAVVETSKNHTNGTSRIRECIDFLGLNENDIVLNLQADIVSIDPDCLTHCLFPRDDEISSAYTVEIIDNVNKPNFVKVVTDEDNRALYFSRSPIPYGSNKVKVHVGIYGFKVKTLRSLPQFLIGPAISENLEQLSWLYTGTKIHMIPARLAISIDTKEDYEQWLGSDFNYRKW